MTRTVSWVIFYLKLHCSLIFGKCFLWVLYVGTSKGSLRPWETRPHQSPGPCRCLRWVHTPLRLGTGSSNLPPLTPDRCWLTGLGRSFSSCPGLGSGQSLRRLGRGSWMEMTSRSHCSPGECWLHCCRRWDTPSVCWVHLACSLL